MVRHRFIPTVIAGFLAALASAAEPRPLATRDVQLSCRTAGDAPVEHVRVWTSADSGRTWLEQPGVEFRDGRVRFSAPGDGRYDVYLVLENAAGASALPPTAGSRPNVTVLVDTTPPLLQLHGAVVEDDGHQQRVLRLRVSLIEENLSRRAVRLFYRKEGESDWRDGGAVAVNDDDGGWPLPEELHGRIEVKLLAADLAGNTAAAEPLALLVAPPVAAPPPAPTTAPTVQPAPIPTTRPSTPPTAEPTLTHDEINALRELAARYLREGRPALAEARLTDALHGAPGDQDVLVDLGTVLFQTQHYDDAGQQFQAALDAHPDNLAATQGLALVANAQRRYPEARQHLQHLLKRTPESGLTWLRYGDVEHRLGELDTALQAWRRVLEVEPAESQVRRMAEERLRTFGRAPARAP